MLYTTAQRFAWIAECRNTVRELMSTFQAPRAIAKQLQGMVSSGATLAACSAVAAASLELRSQVGH